MKPIPYFAHKGNETVFMVDDRPFVVLGGELHNSSASDLDYMERNVWPGLRNLKGNCYLAPVYWECMESAEGSYDFSLTDGLIAQARREGVRLILLWFGLWKNGSSSYVPGWMKEDPRYFYLRTETGEMVESVSPLCEEAVRRDAAAFAALMQHLKETDEERTVIAVQVENEIGFWGHVRDFSAQATEKFYKEIPEEMAQLFDREGSWEEAFGRKAN